MMSREQIEIVKIVYNRFLECEDDDSFSDRKKGWTDLDTNLEMYGWLSVKELIVEAKIKCAEHSKGLFKCSQDHEQEFCFAPRILEAVEAILALYDETEELHEKNQYILEYYLVMSEMGLIFSLNGSSQAI